MDAKKLKRIVITEELFAITQKTENAIVLSQMIYWQGKVKDIDDYIAQEKNRSNNDNETCEVLPTNGWIYKTSKDLISECMLNVSEATMGRILNDLIEKGFVDKRTNPHHKWDKTLQYRVNMVNVINAVKKLGYDGIEGWSSKNETSNFQNEKSEVQNEKSKFKNERAIPYTTTYTTTDTTTYNNTNIINDRIDYELVLQKWQEICPMLVQPRCLNDKRKKKIRTLLENNNATLDDLFKCFKVIANSAFCTNADNKNKNNWKASFDWLINDTKSCFNGLMEGKYDFKNKKEFDVDKRLNDIKQELIIDGVRYK